ncbi:actin, putative, partial [Hepatocystis sp. ex Piliocolobus tephrosceles]
NNAKGKGNNDAKGSSTNTKTYSNASLSKLRKINFFNFTAILVNIGSTKTSCTPIINGIPLLDLTYTYYIGGYDIDNLIYDEM